MKSLIKKASKRLRETYEISSFLLKVQLTKSSFFLESLNSYSKNTYLVKFFGVLSRKRSFCVDGFSPCSLFSAKSSSEVIQKEINDSFVAFAQATEEVAFSDRQLRIKNQVIYINGPGFLSWKELASA